MRNINERVRVISCAKHADRGLKVMSRSKLIAEREVDRETILNAFTNSVNPSVTGGSSHLRVIS